MENRKSYTEKSIKQNSGSFKISMKLKTSNKLTTKERERERP